MLSLFSIDLDLNGKKYFCLVFKTWKGEIPMFRFTIMDGELEKETCSHNIMSEMEVQTSQNDCTQSSITAQIRVQIAKAIREHYNHYFSEERNVQSI